jgi:enoyl-CoA hydratase
MPTSLVINERHGPTAIVRLNRPDKLNALSGEMMIELSETFARIATDSEVRAVILTGAGDRAFCAGTDIGELSDRTTSEDCTNQARAIAERGQAVCDQIASFGVPVIAAINGLAAGGGCELALACHLRLAAENAEFSLPETKLGVIPGYGGTQRAAREIGPGRALEMMLTGRVVLAAEASRIGLVNRVVAQATLLSEAESLAAQIATLAPLAIRACLEAVTRGIELPLAEGLALEAELFSGLFATADMREGTRAFLEKRGPVFKGI